MKIAGFYTSDQAAEKMGWSVRWVLELIRDGRLEAQKIGTSYLIAESALENIKPAERPRGRPKGNAKNKGARRSA